MARRLGAPEIRPWWVVSRHWCGGPTEPLTPASGADLSARAHADAAQRKLQREDRPCKARIFPNVPYRSKEQYARAPLSAWHQSAIPAEDMQYI